MEIVNKGNISFLLSGKFEGVKHGFSLRCGGVSEGEFESLNVGLRRGDDPFKAMKNIEICADSLELEKKNMTLTYQTHTANVRFVEEGDIGKGIFREWGEGVDGIVTNLKNVPLMCYSADCVPTLLYAPKAQLIGAVHGGWRGTSENIISVAVKVMVENGALCDDIRAFVGPCIGLCCYEVSCDVAEKFTDSYPHCLKNLENGKYMLDLKGVTKAQLIGCNVKKENIDVSEYCTSCSNDLFFSHRKQNGKSGLLGGFIQMI